MIVDEWKGCYPSSWKGIITPESFSHPAKASSKLAERIYKHAIAEGWLHEGSRCVDPFGGIGGFAFHAMLNGMDMTLVELESKFCQLAQANIDAWNAKYSGRLARWGTARIIQGDSRHLAQVIGAAVIPQDFWDQVDKTDTCWNWTGIDNGKNYGQYRINGKKLLAHRISWEYHFGPIPDRLLVCHKCDNPRCVNPEHLFLGTHTDNWNDCLAKGRSWMQTNPEKSPRGENHGRCKLSDKEVEDIREKYATGDYSFRGLGREYKVSKTHIRDIIHCKFRMPYLPPGDVDAVISSPPFADSLQNSVKDSGLTFGNARYGHKDRRTDELVNNYGSTPGQLASLPPGAFEAAISSPPFEDSLDRGTVDKETRVMIARKYGVSADQISPAEVEKYGGRNQEYGSSAGQLGNDNGETFWSASKLIVEQVYQVLAPGAHAVWVVKSYVKNKQLVDFPHQWQTLCESVGFVTLHEHHALLVRHGAISIDIDGNHHEKKTESKSFFRRLAEKNGSPRIDFETVLCLVKPGGEGGGWDGAISSPPYAESIKDTGDGIDWSKATRGGHKPGMPRYQSTAGVADGYGTTPGQLGTLPPGSLDDATRHGEGG